MIESKGDVAVSIILPVYNVRDYLEQCLNSILQQKFTNFELICINDNSTDSSDVILHDYAKSDIRIRIKHNKVNMGVANCRNSGLEFAQGKYIVFLDADDYYNTDMLFAAYNKCEKYDADLAFWEYRVFWEHNRTFSQVQSIPLYVWHSISDMSCSTNNVKLLPIHNCPPWLKMYRRDFLLKYNLKFQNLTNSNDVYFSFMSLLYASRIVYIDECFAYHRLNRSGQISEHRGGKPLCVYKALYKIKKSLGKQWKNIDMRMIFAAFAVHRLWYAMNAPGSTDTIRKEYLVFLRDTGWYRLGLNKLNDYDFWNFSIREKFNQLQTGMIDERYKSQNWSDDFPQHLNGDVFIKLKRQPYKYCLWGLGDRKKFFLFESKKYNLSVKDLPVSYEVNPSIDGCDAVIIIDSNDGIRLLRLLRKYNHDTTRIIDIDFYVHNEVNFEECIFRS